MSKINNHGVYMNNNTLAQLNFSAVKEINDEVAATCSGGGLGGSDPDVILFKDPGEQGGSLGLNSVTGDGIANIGLDNEGNNNGFNDQTSSITYTLTMMFKLIVSITVTSLFFNFLIGEEAKAKSLTDVNNSASITSLQKLENYRVLFKNNLSPKYQKQKFLISQIQNTSYRVTIITGGLDGAGTDANVFLTLYGDQISTNEINIDKPGDDFEQGQTDVFTVSAIDVGNINKIRIRHDNSGNRPGWFLDKVIIYNEKTNQERVCPCNRWLAVDEDDGQTDRTLNCQ